jgi:hypothetical protein
MYNLKDIEELLAFAEDCSVAISSCPQRKSGSGERLKDLKLAILRKEVTPEQVYNMFVSSSTLWKSGYSTELSKKAVDTFNAIHKAKQDAVSKFFK